MAGCRILPVQQLSLFIILDMLDLLLHKTGGRFFCPAGMKVTLAFSDTGVYHSNNRLENLWTL